MGLIPKATKADTKALFNLNMNWIIGAVLTLIMSVQWGNLVVHTDFRLLFIAYCVGIYVVLNKPAPHNPKRVILQGMLLWITNTFAPKAYLSIIGCAYQESQEVDKHAR
jgi:hypothetical protein